MIAVVHRAATVEIDPGGPIHISGGESLDPSSMLVEDDRVWEVDRAEFTRGFGPDQRRLLCAKAGSADSMRAWHDFMCVQKERARRAAPPDAMDIRPTPAVTAAYARYHQGDASAALHLALPRRDTVGSTAVLPGTHLVGAMRVAWTQAFGLRPFPLRGTDARLTAGRLELRAAIAGRIRTDAPRPMPTSRQSEWLVAAFPEGGVRFRGTVSPTILRQGVPWNESLAGVAGACHSFFHPRLRAQLDALQADAECAPQSPLMSFVKWGRAALQASGDELGAFLLQIGSYTGSDVHPGCGRTGSPHRVPVCLEWAGSTRDSLVAGSTPLGWLLVRPGTAAH